MQVIYKTFKFKSAKPIVGGALNPVRVADLMRVVLHSNHIIEIHDTCVGVLE